MAVERTGIGAASAAGRGITPTEGAPPHVQVIAGLRRTIADVIDPLVPRGEPVALLDFPQAPNVGDSLIWLGVLAFLRETGRGAPCFTCSNIMYEPRALARRVGRGTILLSGGGNLGDLYPTHEGLRERVVTDFPGNRIVQLPQSIHFQSAEALHQAGRVFEGHRDFTLLVRDGASLAIARETFRVPSQLCPDMSFCLGPLASRVAPSRDVVWLSRSDRESATRERAAAPPGIDPVDWVRDDRQPVVRFNRFLVRNIHHRPLLRPFLAPMLGPTRPAVLRSRLERGCRVLGAGRAVVTNRLHGYILSLLLGIPHFFSDNSYGKVLAFHRQWTSGCALSHACESEADALRQALAFVRGEA